MSRVHVRATRADSAELEFDVDPERLDQHLRPLAEITADRGFTWTAAPVLVVTPTTATTVTVGVATAGACMADDGEPEGE